MYVYIDIYISEWLYTMRNILYILFHFISLESQMRYYYHHLTDKVVTLNM